MEKVDNIYNKHIWMDQAREGQEAHKNLYLCRLDLAINLEQLTQALSHYIQQVLCVAGFKQDLILHQHILHSKADFNAIFTIFKTGFNLTETIYRFDYIAYQSERWLALQFHHAAFDGRSATLLAVLLPMFYAKESVGQHYFSRPHFKVTPVDDYQLWQRSVKACGSHVDLAAFQCQNTFPQKYSIDFHLPLDTSQQIEQLAVKHQTSPFRTLLSAYSVLLAEYIGRRQFVLNMAVDMRDRHCQSATGCFINNVLLPIDLPGQGDFKQALSSIRQARHLSKQVEKMPFEQQIQVLRGVMPIEDANQHFNLAFSESFLIKPRQIMFGTQPATLSWQSTGTVFDFVLMYEQHQGQYYFRLEASDRQSFSKLLLLQFVRHFKRLLAVLSEDTQVALSSICQATLPGMQKIREYFSAGPVSPLKEATILSRFDRIASAHGQATAISFMGEHVSYQQLDQYSTAVAAALIKRLNGSSQSTKTNRVVIGVCLPRGIDWVVSVLAILKMGGIYLPLNPNLPSSRLLRMYQESNGVLLLMDSDSVNQHPRLSKYTWLDLLSLRGTKCGNPSDITHACRQMTGPDHDSDDMAYLFYTSGSSGQPKGAMLPHRGLVNLAQVFDQQWSLSSEDIILHYAESSFDASLWSLFAALLNGAQLAILPADDMYDPLATLAFIKKEQVTWATLPPALLAQMPVDQALSLRALIVAGEACADITLQQWHQYYPVYNAYGLTETTICATVHRYDPGDSAQCIGRPIVNTTCYVLDEQQQRVPAGVIGELYIGGALLAKGYIAQPELTRERFIVHPDCPGQLYRTGDSVRWLPNGHLEYIGRKDRQIQLRGYRVELAEIEQALLGLSFIEQAYLKYCAAQQQLVAYYVAVPQSEVSSVQETVTLWRDLYNTLYQKDAVFSAVGWQDGVTGQDLSKAAMRQWVAVTIERILSLAPDRVLEIGCGSGLLLQPIQEKVSDYIGFDLSEPIIMQLQQYCSQHGWHNVQLFCAQADQIKALCSQNNFHDIDTAILNSVVQYFPDLKYLAQVLSDSFAILAESGRVFLGDIKDQRLQEYFYFCQLPDTNAITSPADLRAHFEHQRAHDEELMVLPGFFREYCVDHPGAWLSVLPKYGELSYEMNCFRYDVILYAQHPEIDPGFPDIQWHLWSSNESLQTIMAEQTDQSIMGIRAYPNKRIYSGFQRYQSQCLSQASSAAFDEKRVLSLAALQNLAIQFGRRLFVHLSMEKPDCLDLVFYPLSYQEIAVSWRYFQTLPEETASIQFELNRPIAYSSRIIRSALSQKLPAYMLPNAYVALTAFPLTVNGKIDDSQLPDLSDDSYDQSAPLTPTEQLLHPIWSEILQRTHVAPQDNFFSIGGHSLLAVEIVQKLKQTLNIELPLQDFFADPSLGAIAEKVQKQTAGLPSLSKTRKGLHSQALSHQQQALWFLEKCQGSAQYNMPYALQLVGQLDVALLESALQKIVQNHAQLRMRYVEVQGQVSQTTVGVEAFVLQRQAVDAGDSIDVLLQQALQQPFDWQLGPLFRAILYQTDAQRSVLLMVAHHSVGDAISWQIIIDDLRDIYADYVSGSGHNIATSPSAPYLEYIHWQESMDAQQQFDRATDYWCQTLKGCSAIRWPRSHEVLKKGGKSARVSAQFSPSQTAALQGVIQQQALTVFSFFMAISGLTLAMCCDQSDLLVGSSMANRLDAKYQQTVGYFANTVPIRLKVAEAITIADWLQYAKQQCLSSFCYQYLPFDLLVNAVSPERRDPKTPLIQVMLIIQPKLSQSFSLSDDCVAEYKAVHSDVAKFDLVIHVNQHQSQWQVAFEYNCSVLTKAQVSMWLEQFMGMANLPVWQDQSGQLVQAFLKERQACLPLSGSSQDFPLNVTAQQKNELASNAGQCFSDETTSSAQKLTELWSSLLKQGPLISVADNFFQIGGHSILAVQLIALINQAFKRHLPVVWVFQHPTIAEQASALTQQLSDSVWHHLSVTPDKPVLIWFHPGEAAGLEVYADINQKLAGQYDIYGIDNAPLQLGVEMDSLMDLAKYYADLIQSQNIAGPWLLAGWSLGGLLALEVARLCRSSVDQVWMLDSYFIPADCRKLGAEVAKFQQQHKQVEWQRAGLAQAEIDQRLAVMRQEAKWLSGYQSEMIDIDINIKFIQASQMMRSMPEHEAFFNGVRQLGHWQSICTSMQVCSIDADHYGVLSHYDLNTLFAKASVF